jgi:hypothetical protein
MAKKNINKKLSILKELKEGGWIAIASSKRA